ncbi:MAG: glycine C-acetyltransferase [Vicinamibacteria bacterium]|jgi:glycine C-acetyltransferase|nr:glycine C-acetyltransferase [Vicinamibacteria bacterium]
MSTAFRAHLNAEIAVLRESGLYKQERFIDSAQGAWVEVNGRRALNLCANNYLGLANHPEILQAAHAALDRWGYGLASVRFICGTQSLHKDLERRLSEFLCTEDTILYSSCFDANGGFFEALLGEEDAIISDTLNHASLIDGIRLSKAKRFRYRHDDLGELQDHLIASSAARFRVIATDGVFSMDGAIADLRAICDLAERYDALVLVDDSHATGFLGAHGRGTHEYRDVLARVDVLTGTLGKALGGASGGYVSGRREIIELLRQRSRPYLFSNSVAPPVIAGALAALDILTRDDTLRARLWRNTRRFRADLAALGYTLRPGEHPIIPIMIGDAVAAQTLAARLLEHDVYVVGFSYPVVPKDQARVRVQMSAAHGETDLDFALKAFAEAR